MLNLIKKIVGTKNDREIKRIRPFVDEVNSYEAEYQKLTDPELREKTEQFKSRIREGTAEFRKSFDELSAEALTADPHQGEELKTRTEEFEKQILEAEAAVLREILPEAFAAVREAS